MSMLSSYTRFHWRLFNALARVFGIMAILFAVNSSTAGLYYAIYPDAAKGMETAGFPASVISLIAGAFAAAIGIAVLRIRPYRPDLGDAAWTFTRSANEAEQFRSWWTGEPKMYPPRQS